MRSQWFTVSLAPADHGGLPIASDPNPFSTYAPASAGVGKFLFDDAVVSNIALRGYAFDGLAGDLPGIVHLLFRNSINQTMVSNDTSPFSTDVASANSPFMMALPIETADEAWWYGSDGPRIQMIAPIASRGFIVEAWRATAAGDLPANKLPVRQISTGMKLILEVTFMPNQ